MKPILATSLLVVAAASGLTPLAAQVPAPESGEVAAATQSELLMSSMRYSRSLRVQLSGRARQRIDAMGARLMGTRWVGQFGLGKFGQETLPTGDKVLVFSLEGWRLPFLPLDAPERWLIGTGVYTTTGTADVTFTLDAAGEPIAMSWLDEFEFKIVDDDAFALTPDDVDAALDKLIEALGRLWLDRSSLDAVRSSLLARALAYREIDDAQELADKLDVDLKLVLQDDLAGMRFVPLAQPLTTWDDAASTDDTPEESGASLERRRESARDFRGGLGNVQIGAANIGFIEIQAFLPGDIVEEAYAAAFGKVADADALIIDVRQARGGHPTGARQFIAHLVAPDTPLVSVEVPARDKIDVVLAPDIGEAPAFRTKPVFVLTSQTTMGAAEELAATLQALGLAKVFGETTAGVGQLTRRAIVSPHLEVTVPSERTIVLASGDTWHGRGVLPDIKVPTLEAGSAAWRAATGNDEER